MSNYLTNTSAASRYQPKTDMINSVTSAIQTIISLESFGSLSECTIYPNSQFYLVNEY